MQISSRASFPEGEIVVTRNPYKANWQAMQARGTCIVDLFIYWRSWSCHRLLQESSFQAPLHITRAPPSGSDFDVSFIGKVLHFTYTTDDKSQLTNKGNSQLHV